MVVEKYNTNFFKIKTNKKEQTFIKDKDRKYVQKTKTLLKILTKLIKIFIFKSHHLVIMYVCYVIL